MLCVDLWYQKKIGVFLSFHVSCSLSSAAGVIPFILYVHLPSQSCHNAIDTAVSTATNLPDKRYVRTLKA